LIVSNIVHDGRSIVIVGRGGGEAASPRRVCGAVAVADEAQAAEPGCYRIIVIVVPAFDGGFNALGADGHHFHFHYWTIMMVIMAVRVRLNLNIVVMVKVHRRRFYLLRFVCWFLGMGSALARKINANGMSVE